MKGIWQSVQELVAGSRIRTLKEESQNAAHLLMRRDLELTAVNEKLKRLNNAKADFISMAAHQLRTPLSSARWHIQLLRSRGGECLTEDLAKHVSVIENNVKAMSELIDTLLYISKLEMGTTAELHSKVEVRELVRDISKRFEEDITAKNLLFVREVEPVTLSTDPALFDVIIQNLLSNAIKYTPEGQSIDLVIEMVEAGQQWGSRNFTQQQLGILVRDTGMGIPPSEQDRIFSRLFRADNVVKEGLPGTGLGLYLVKLIVNKMGGTIWFTSQEGEGTTFFVTIPYSLVRAI